MDNHINKRFNINEQWGPALYHYIKPSWNTLYLSFSITIIGNAPDTNHGCKAMWHIIEKLDAVPILGSVPPFSEHNSYSFNATVYSLGINLIRSPVGNSRNCIAMIVSAPLIVVPAGTMTRKRSARKGGRRLGSVIPSMVPWAA